MHMRIVIATLFLFAQLSQSWAAGGIGSELTGCAAESGMQSSAMPCTHQVADDAQAENSMHGSAGHSDEHCNGKCQLCALALPITERAVPAVTHQYATVFISRSMPPGTAVNPYRPPTTV